MVRRPTSARAVATAPQATVHPAPAPPARFPEPETSSQLLALIGPPIPRIVPHDDIDDLDLRTDVIVGFDLDFLRGRVVDLMLISAKQSGPEQVATIHEACRYAIKAYRQAAAAAGGV